MAVSLLKISVIKEIDSLLGPLVVPLVQNLFHPRDQIGRNVDSILVIRPGGIGDAAIVIPALIALKKQYPQSEIDILAEKRNSSVFLLSPVIRTVLHYDKPVELFAAIRGNYDIVIDTEQWHRLSAVVARMIRAPILLGYATNERRKLFTHPVIYSHDQYEGQSFLDLLEPLIGPQSYQVQHFFLTIGEKDMSAANSALLSLADKDFVAIFPGSSIQERRWGNDRFHRTAKLLSEQGYGIVVVGGKDDIGAGERIVRNLPRSLNLSGKLSLPETAAVLEQSSLLITGDSGIMHIGYGLGIKIVALFGPGREKKWAPRGENCIVINKHLPCSPCTTFGYTPKCKKNAECMKQISVEEVVEATMTLLKK